MAKLRVHERSNCGGIGKSEATGVETVERWEWGWRMEDVSGGLGAVRDGWAGGGHR